MEVAREAHGGHPPSPRQVGQPGSLCLTAEDSSAAPLVVAGPEPQACTTAWSPAPGTSRDRLPGLGCSSEPITHRHAAPRPAVFELPGHSCLERFAHTAPCLLCLSSSLRWCLAPALTTSSTRSPSQRVPHCPSAPWPTCSCVLHECSSCRRCPLALGMQSTLNYCQMNK